MSDTVNNFNVLRKANVARQKEWHVNGDPGLSYKGNELAGEVGELCNVIKKLERARLGSRGSKATVQDLADELGDVIVCLDLIAADFDIDVWAVVVEKFNKTSIKYGLTTLIVPRSA